MDCTPEVSIPRSGRHFVPLTVALRGGWFKAAGMKKLLLVGVPAACGPNAAKTSSMSPPPAASSAAEQRPAPVANCGHGHAAVAAMTVASIADVAMLIDDLGSHHRAITTTHPEAQKYFDQGLRLLY